MSSPWITAFAIGVYVILAVNVHHAWRRAGPFYAFLPFVFATYFLVSETAAIHGGVHYEYGDFWLSLCLRGSGVAVANCPPPDYCVPLTVVLMEGLLVFSIMRTSDLLAPPRWLRPILDGLMAVTVDLVLDPVAATSHWCAPGVGTEHHGIALWTWLLDPSAPAQWYGIPLANYSAWFFGTVALTASVRLVTHHFDLATHRRFRHHLGAALGVLVLCLVFGMGLEAGSDWVMGKLMGGASVPNLQRWLVIAGVLGLASVFTLAYRRRMRSDRPHVEWQVPLMQGFLFAWMLAALVFSGPWPDLEELLVWWVVTFQATFVFNAAPYVDRMRRGRTPPTGGAA